MNGANNPALEASDGVPIFQRHDFDGADYHVVEFKSSSRVGLCDSYPAVLTEPYRGILHCTAFAI